MSKLGFNNKFLLAILFVLSFEKLQLNIKLWTPFHKNEKDHTHTKHKNTKR